MDKSKVSTFFLSFIPGLGHFHLGLMNRGLQLMTAFFGLAFLFNFLESSFSFFLPILWFYGLFDALQQHQRLREEGNIEDKPFIPWSLNKTKPSIGRWIGWVLIACGVLLIIDRILPIVMDFGQYEMLRTVFIALLMVWIGYRIISGKSILPKKDAQQEEERRP
ncbi:hypothetical protein SAMN05444487_11045 [Marininema mesophilum]|uniref:TM2 domain-containing protein n=1 Tax=Marininema mesophilum TaxID=1048340 RepID=A0A1H2YZ20_9BACL|nr:hypothetical protein [Marininema mesophilum]SDX09904.1 hypothetical protein SAMN05444487_11045 [Marininema mesophilum]